MRTIFVAVLSCFIGFAYAGSFTVTVAFSEADLIFSRASGYDVVDLKGYPCLVEPGAPRLPRVVLPVLVPADAVAKTVKMMESDMIQIPGTYDIIPAQPDVPLPMPNKVHSPKIYPADTALYSSVELYPDPQIRIAGTGSKNGFRVVHVELYPLRYIAASHILEFSRQVTFELEYDEATIEQSVPTSRQRDMAARALSSLVVNPEDITAFAPLVRGLLSTGRVPPGHYEYVIISAPPMDTVFQRLARWKTRKGIPATVVSVSWINSTYTGYDLPEKIRNFIIDAYANWGTIYVLLGGSADHRTSGQNIVPSRRAFYIRSFVGSYTDEDTIPCDLYYSDLTGTWDLDGDHIWGELGDNVNMYTDVYVGRASVYNVTGAQNFVNKAMMYEKNPPTVHLKKMLLPTAILWSSYEERPMQDSIARMTPASWVDAKLYERNGLLSRTRMIDSMNVGYGLGHWVGHGDENGIYMGGSAYLNSTDADNLVNGNKQGIANSIACFTGAWDETTGGDCFAEHLVNRVGGGLVVAMMNSRYGWGAYVGGYVPGPSERLDTTFHANIFQDNVYHVGQTHGLAKDAWVPYADSGAQYDMTRWCLYELNLFGDPELPIWSEIPDSMRVTHNAVVPMGESTFVVLVRQSNNVTPLPNALVCLMGKNDTGLYQTGYTNASGIASITVNASIPNDTMFVTVTHQNLYPYQGFAIVGDAGMPDTPVIMAPLDYARLPEVQPTLSFYSSDPQGDNLQYRLLWDTDPAFASPDSSTTALYSSGATVNYVIPSPLVDGATYWWKVKCTDPYGSGIWTLYSEMRSLTIGTNLPAGTCSWFQTTSAQFSFDSHSGTMIQGDSIVLVPAGQTIVDTILEENFEAAGIPAGWTVVDGNGDNYKWTVGTSVDIGSYSPPSYGTRYAYYSDDDAGNAVVNNNEQLISPAVQIPSSAQDVEIQYGYGFRVYETGEVYEVLARFYSGAWGSWQVIQTYITSGSGNANISLAAYLPADSVQLAWKYRDESSSSNWGYACACDNVLLRYSYTLTNNEGTVTSAAVDYGELTATAARPHWGKAHWHKADPGDSIGIQLEYYNGSWQLVPDVVLPGNSSGFFTTEGTGSVSLSSVDTITYETLRLVGEFYRKNVTAPNDPALLDWEIGDLSSTETTPPEPFSLIAPADSSLFQNPRPNFIWHATYDYGSGLRDYRVYIGGLLKHAGADTAWLADYDLTEGYNSWYIVAYDSANNARHSNETWIVVIDTTAPPAVSLVAPSDNSYLNNGSVSFVWHPAVDNISGIQYYTLQYALNNAFTVGLVETTLSDTIFNATLLDTIYYWRVRATDIANNDGAFSPIWQFEIDLQSPSVPALVSPINGIWLNDTLVQLQWSAVSLVLDSHKMPPNLRSPIRYIVQIDITPSFIAPVYVDTLVASSATITLDQEFYYWRVRAFDLAGNQGQFSAIDSFGVDINAPSAVTLITPNNNAYLNASPVSLVWHSATDNLSGVDHYVLQYALDNSFTQGLVELTMADTAVAIAFAETTYYWHVRAADVASNQGIYSPTWQFEIDTQAPNAPMLVAPIGGIWYSDTLLEFEWSAVTNLGILGQRVNADRNAGSFPPPFSPIRYILEIDTSEIFGAPIIVDTCMSTASNIQLAENFYYWRVRAFDLANNQGMYSEHDSVGVDVTAPEIESTTVWDDTTHLGPFEIVTSITDGLSGVDSVILYYRRDEDPAWNATVMHVFSPGWYVDSIPAVVNTNDSVRYYIAAMDLAEPANIAYDPSNAPSSYYSFMANVTGIAELTNSSGFFSFSQGQSPARGAVLFSIVLPDDGVINLFIYDVSGRLIAKPICGQLSRGNHEIALDLKANAGVYFYSLESPWGMRCGKIVLVK